MDRQVFPDESLGLITLLLSRVVGIVFEVPAL
jgi:hypothetical protein